MLNETHYQLNESIDIEKVLFGNVNLFDNITKLITKEEINNFFQNNFDLEKSNKTILCSNQLNIAIPYDKEINLNQLKYLKSLSNFYIQHKSKINFEIKEGNLKSNIDYKNESMKEEDFKNRNFQKIKSCLNEKLFQFNIKNENTLKINLNNSNKITEFQDKEIEVLGGIYLHYFYF